ncbi:MAG: glutamine-hydrolyzing GMP synthase [Candidatus Roizmanbacteria bacterium]|nr:MAG: glutamine-hydrolyzing GMP synthase [Candidatus Roizmanbacteria bacterium]
MILIIDFGSQTTHLISRRLRELGAKSIIIEPEEALKKINHSSCKGIILSGGPGSVYQKDDPTIDKKIFDVGIPVLGICYGQQLIAQLLGGEVIPGKRKEYGPAELKIIKPSTLLLSTPETFSVWMSHGDEVVTLPLGFEISAKTLTIPCAAIACEKRKIYGVQFHPEVIHTQFGEQILKNFLTICNISIKKQTIDQEFVNNLIADIKDSIKDGIAISALSGGVDSSISSLLVHKAIGKNLTSIYIDSGLMRLNETASLRKTFKEHYHMNVKIVNAKNIFLKNLKGVTDPERKRKIIGKTFIQVFEKEAKKVGAKYFIQGTIYPDVIESGASRSPSEALAKGDAGKHSQKIKSHHNVGGLPKNMKLTLVEPLRAFYKDEVRIIGNVLNLPEEINLRQPFPGPGLAIRIIGEVTEKKLKILKKADAIISQEIEKEKLTNKLWQAFAVFTGIKTTGVRGDNRVYGETIAIRVIDAKDAMSAHWARLPYDLIDKISTRIVNEVREVNRVVYDITNKPPATMEWE